MVQLLGIGSTQTHCKRALFGVTERRGTVCRAKGHRRARLSANAAPKDGGSPRFLTQKDSLRSAFLFKGSHRADETTTARLKVHYELPRLATLAHTRAHCGRARIP